MTSPTPHGPHGDLAGYLKARRWFRGKARALSSARVEERFPLDLAGRPSAFAIVRADYEDGGHERYILLGARGQEASSDALTDPQALAALLEKFRGGGTKISGERGSLIFRPLAGFDEVAAKASSLAPQPSAKEQTNTSVPFGDAFIFKVVRKLDEGTSAELEMGEYLTRHGYTSTPALLGAIEAELPGNEEPSTLGVLHRFLPNRGDAWGFTLDTLRTGGASAYVPHAEALGRRVAEMHEVLVRATEPGFEPVHIDRATRRALADRVGEDVRAVAKHLAPGDAEKIAARVSAFVDLQDDPVATRIHGDLHLGQILVAKDRDDFVIIDFEGEPARPIEERKTKRSPMADVAGMLRSFDYAAATVKADRGTFRVVPDAFLAAYGSTPRDVLDFYLLEKCMYEIGYEANNRPDWIGIPLSGLRDLLR